MRRRAVAGGLGGVQRVPHRGRPAALRRGLRGRPRATAYPARKCARTRPPRRRRRACSRRRRGNSPRRQLHQGLLPRARRSSPACTRGSRSPSRSSACAWTRTRCRSRAPVHDDAGQRGRRRHEQHLSPRAVNRAICLGYRAEAVHRNGRDGAAQGSCRRRGRCGIATVVEGSFLSGGRCPQAPLHRRNRAGISPRPWSTHLTSSSRGKKFKPRTTSPPTTPGKFKDKDDAAGPTEKNLKKLAELQELLYAEAKHALLVVFQAMDAGGKDGAIEHVFSGSTRRAARSPASRRRRTLELAPRLPLAHPRRRAAQGHDRDLQPLALRERCWSSGCKKLVPKKVWSKRYDHINAFERLLADEGTWRS